MKRIIAACAALGLFLYGCATQLHTPALKCDGPSIRREHGDRR